MFGFGDFGKASKAAAKKRALSRKLPRTPKVAARKYPRAKAAFSPAYGPGYIPPGLLDEEEGGFFRMTPGFAPESIPMSAGGVTIGRPRSKSGNPLRQVCGCSAKRMKNGKIAIACPNAGPKGGTQHRFVNDAEGQIAKEAGKGNVCTFMPVLTPHRGPRRANPYEFMTSRGKKVSFKRRPSGKTLKKNVALYYHQLAKQAKARGAKLRYMPSFADINGWGW